MNRGLEMRGVVKRYPGPGEIVQAVNDVSLTVAPGEVVALYGPSGSGKTTLLLLAAALLAPDAGTIEFAGRPVTGLAGDRAADYQRREIGFISQAFQLMPGVSAVENAAVKLLADRVPMPQARRTASEWLQAVGLAHRLRHTPEQLSGGERQRVAIARALANGPRLVLADEPTGSLDSRRGRTILELLATLCRERRTAVLLVTHDPQAAEIADRIETLRDGSLQQGVGAHDPATASGSRP